jgi:hypothetical protein
MKYGRFAKLGKKAKSAFSDKQAYLEVKFSTAP